MKHKRLAIIMIQSLSLEVEGTSNSGLIKVNLELVLWRIFNKHCKMMKLERSLLIIIRLLAFQERKI